MCVCCVYVHVILTIYYRFLFIILLHTIEFNHAMNKIEVTTYKHMHLSISSYVERRRQTRTNKKNWKMNLFFCLLLVAAATDVVIAVALMKFDSSPDLIVKKYAFYASM